MFFKEIKYLSGYSIPAIAACSLLFPENWAFATLVFAFVCVPLAEWLLPQNHANVDTQEEIRLSQNRFYDLMLFLSVPVQWTIIGLFVWLIQHNTYTTLQLVGMTLSVGICSGVIGINIAHELGHRNSKIAQFSAWALLLSSLYMHFFVEHNHGHHRYVATPKDAATARKGQSLYSFWITSVWGSYWSAWRIQLNLLKKDGKNFLSPGNLMLWFQVSQFLLLGCIFAYGGYLALLCFAASALVGILLLETINYIEHYGLSRKEVKPGLYEKVLPSHSWNSDYTLGRIMLFELTRHADHHYKASRKYQILKSHSDSPYLPAGYPAMMLLSTIPPLWFKVMDKRIHPNGQGSSSLAVAA